MTRIDVLPDEVILGIFDFYVIISSWNTGRQRVDGWQSLVHVCRRWRGLVLASPRRLNLHLYCTHRTPARDTLDVWPSLPLIVEGNMAFSSGTDDVIAALEQSNRVRQVSLKYFKGWQLEEVLASMHVPFPELTHLELTSNGETVPVIPDSFLHGSAPRLLSLSLEGIPFPGLPKLLLSATHIVHLRLINIPHSGYFLPEATVALLSVLSSLETFYLEFQSPQSRPDRETRRHRPSKRTVLPALRLFCFKGVIEYLEDLVTHIDTSQLDIMQTTFFNQIDFDIPRLVQFINRTAKPRKHDATVQFNDDFALVRHSSRIPEIAISCKEPDWQLSSIEQVCNSFSHPFSTVEVLYIKHHYSKPVWKNDAIENTLWLQLLLPFTAVKNLYLSKEFAPGIAAALQDLVGDRIMEVLPSLQKIFVRKLGPSGPFREKIGQFVAARQLSDHPIVISDWDWDNFDWGNLDWDKHSD